MVKALDATYAAGRRGSEWRKVKPVHTLDLVVLAVEWGSGRRRGWLSNIHLGALGADGEPVMVGKTFKGMTDSMLEWQTARFLELETHRDDHVVYLRPEQVVEIALDGAQVSTRYPGWRRAALRPGAPLPGRQVPRRGRLAGRRGGPAPPGPALEPENGVVRAVLVRRVLIRVPVVLPSTAVEQEPVPIAPTLRRARP